MRRLLPLLFFSLLTGLALAGAPSVSVLELEWRDAARERTLPVKFYYPAAASGPLPVIVWSHGLGGSRDGYEYLGRHWASQGFVSLHLQHPGSDSGVLRGGLGGMRKAAADMENLKNRPYDVRFAVGQLPRVAALRGRLDLERLGIGGHSFGAYTTMAVAGQEFPVATDFADPRFRAALAMSAPSPRRREPAALAESYGGIRIPLLLMTGTEDSTPLDQDGTGPADRRLPFDGMRGPDKYLLILQGGDHMVFSGRVPVRKTRDEARDARHHRLILDSSTAFWKGWLKGDAEARAWLRDGGFARELGAQGTWETK